MFQRVLSIFKEFLFQFQGFLFPIRGIISLQHTAVLQGACPNTFEELLQNLEKSGYEIKRGRQIAVKGKHQKRFIRLSSLREGYTEADLRAYLQSEGTCKRSPAQMKKHSRPDRPVQACSSDSR